jgi:WD40 repeat protein
MLVTEEHMLIGRENGQLQLIDQDATHTIRQMNGHTDRINCIVYCPELSRVITGSRDKTVRVWTVSTGVCVHVLEGHTDVVWCAAVHGTTFVYCTLLTID